MLVKLVADMVKTQTVTCGEVDMILGSVDYAKLNVAICPNIKPTIAHYHPGFDEIDSGSTAGFTSRHTIRRRRTTPSSAWRRTSWHSSRWACTM